MTNREPTPGVTRSTRISDEGLVRLEKQLRTGPKMQPQILEQWVRRYGEAARELIDKYYK